MVRTKKIVSLDFLGDLSSLASCWYFIPSLFLMLSLLELVNSHLLSPLADQLSSSCRLFGNETDIPNERPT
jgi:hypothetical protein